MRMLAEIVDNLFSWTVSNFLRFILIIIKKIIYWHFVTLFHCRTLNKINWGNIMYFAFFSLPFQAKFKLPFIIKALKFHVSL